MPVTRFAPSPTGLLHLGHAYAAWFAARAGGGDFIVRIEDIDPARCHAEFTDAIIEDLGWLGLIWRQPVRMQSRHLDDYATALDRLRGQGLLYPCFCTRGDIAADAARAGHAPHADEGRVIYPGTCRHLSADERAARLASGPANWRLDMASAVARTGRLIWHDRDRQTVAAKPEQFGDIVLARKDVPTSYHLSVTVDDHLQGIGLVTRGVDLFDATHIHRLLQALLGYPTPDYHHHALLTDAGGRRYAKRDRSVTLRALREAGVTAQAIIERFT